MKIASKYIQGSCGSINVWTEVNELGEVVWITQWEGGPDYNSGYQRRSFSSEQAALDWLDTQ